jgi:hypothetical protein
MLITQLLERLLLAESLKMKVCELELLPSQIEKTI